VLTVTACSGGGGDAAPSVSPRATTTASAAVSGGSADNAGLTADNFVQRVAAAEKSQKTFRMTISMKVLGQEITMDSAMDLRHGAGAIDETVSVPGQQDFTVRGVDGLYYVNYGPRSKNKWIVVDPKDPNDPLGKQFAALKATSPADQVEAMRCALVSVEAEGAPTTLRGEDVQKYVVTMDTSKVGAALTEQFQAGVAQLPKTLTYAYWVGASDDLPRKVTAEIAGMSMTMTTGHWGEPVTITAPSKGDLLPGGLDSLSALES